jgi:hypothetical protein
VYVADLAALGGAIGSIARDGGMTFGARAIVATELIDDAAAGDAMGRFATTGCA